MSMHRVCKVLFLCLRACPAGGLLLQQQTRRLYLRSELPL